jgi:hypothetical protein
VEDFAALAFGLEWLGFFAIGGTPVFSISAYATS